MGVPKLYRYLSERYPCINRTLDHAVAPGIDNLYIDMNGVVHNCARASSNPGAADSSRYLATDSGPRSNADTFMAVFKYVDNLFALVRPRRLVYLAIDGVAPRAKMNQQRSRRFRAAKERSDEHERRIAEDPMYRASSTEPFDSNCITPGTAFMAELSNALKYYVHKKISQDILWAGIRVVVSGAEVPGEGEHKIMEYMRAMKAADQLLPNTRHCVYGLDADLIMLGIVTHEPHFFLLREKTDFTAYFRKKKTTRFASELDTVEFGEFELLSIGLLREYLALDLGSGGVGNLPFFDLERVADDFVFFAILIGNDFLPHLPCIEIQGGVFGVVMLLYKRLLPRVGGYLTTRGKISPERLELFVLFLGLLEKELLLEKQRTRNGRKGDGVGKRQEADLDLLWGFEISTVLPRVWSLEEVRSEICSLRERLDVDEKTVGLKAKYYLDKLGFDVKKPEGAKQRDHLVFSYTEGISWTLKYYVEGCASWRWFFPYHYAPMASDFRDMHKCLSAVKFELGKPFKPMEQLLSVLPPASSWCLPKPFRLLMTHPSSTIREMYPTNFEVDLNGKRNDWEAVVLLPFLDESKLLAAIRTIAPGDLLPQERARNAHGVATVFERALPCLDRTTVITSPFPGRLESFTSVAEGTPLDLPNIGHGVGFSPSPSPGTCLAGTHPDVADMPTFRPVMHSGRLSNVGVDVFGQESRNESLVVNIGREQGEDRDFITFDAASVDSQEGDGARKYNDDTCAGVPSTFPLHWKQADKAFKAGVGLGSPVWVGYPWRVPGVVWSIADCQRTLVMSESEGEERIAEKSSASRAVKSQANQLAAALMSHRAVDIDCPRVVYFVKVATVKDGISGVPTNLSSESIAFAAQSIVQMSDEDIDGFAASMKDALKRGGAAPSPLRLGERVIAVGRGKSFGCEAIVDGFDESGSYQLQFQVRSEFAREPPFGYRVVGNSRRKQQWQPLGRAASMIGLSPRVFSAVIGSIRVRVPNERSELDIGLGIKYTGRGLFIPGYAQVDGRGAFLLSAKSIALVREYRSSFPGLFDALGRVCVDNNAASSNRVAPPAYDAELLFGRGLKNKEALQAVAAWIGASEVATLPLVDEKSLVLTKETIAELEREADLARDLQDEANKSATRNNVMRTVSKRELCSNGQESWKTYKSLVTLGAVPPISEDASDVSLGDRVVNRRAIGPVPFGMRGSVVGIHPSRGGNAKMVDDARSKRSMENGSSTRRPEKSASSGADDGHPSERSNALIEVVFDQSFIGGSDLNGRCTAARGKAVPPETLLVVRPDSENAYYRRNYARLASSYLTRHVDTVRTTLQAADDKRKRTAAITGAAVKSYAEALQSTAGSSRGSKSTRADSSIGGGVARGPPAAASTATVGQGGPSARGRMLPVAAMSHVSQSVAPHAGSAREGDMQRNKRSMATPEFRYEEALHIPLGMLEFGEMPHSGKKKADAATKSPTPASLPKPRFLATARVEGARGKGPLDHTSGVGGPMNPAIFPTDNCQGFGSTPSATGVHAPSPVANVVNTDRRSKAAEFTWTTQAIEDDLFKGLNLSRPSISVHGTLGSTSSGPPSHDTTGAEKQPEGTFAVQRGASQGGRQSGSNAIRGRCRGGGSQLHTGVDAEKSRGGGRGTSSEDMARRRGRGGSSRGHGGGRWAVRGPRGGGKPGGSGANGDGAGVDARIPTAGSATAEHASNAELLLRSMQDRIKSGSSK